MTTSKKNQKLLALSVIAIVLLITVYFINNMIQNARMETDLDEYMPSDHPAFVYSDKAEEWFNIKDGIIIAIENKNGIYNPGTLQKIKDISTQLQDMPEFDENDIRSLYTADNIIGSEYGLEVTSFYTSVPQLDEELNSIKKNVRDNEMVYRRMISEDETVGLIIAEMDKEDFTQEFYSDILEFAYSFEDDDNIIYVAGRPIVEGTMALLGPADMQKMVPVVLLVIAIVLYLLLRSVRAASVTLLGVFISSIWAFGLMAALGIPIYSVTTMIPVMLIAIGVAYGIYFFNHMNQFMLKNPEATLADALKYTLNILWKPLSMAAFTTMIGFLSLLSSQVYPIKYFGVFTAFGIFTAFVLAMVFIPSAIILIGYKPGKKKRTDTDKIIQNPFLNRMSDRLLANKKYVYLVTIFIVVLSIFGIQRVWINSSFLDNFEKDSDIVQTDEFVNKKFGGTSTINVILEGNSADVFKEPEVLSIIDRMQNETVKLEESGNSFSLGDYLKRMNKVMNEDDDDFYTIPDSKNLVAQYLLLYEMSGDPENLDKLVNYNYDRTNVTFQLKGDDSKTINAALSVIESFEDELSAYDIELNFAGSGYKALVFSSLILDGQILSIVISLVLVIIILSIMFRNIKAGLIGAIPITITVTISFGLMGLMNIPLSNTTALLSSIAIGIGIDYAIHFIQHYKMNIAKTDSQIQALYTTMGQTGKAIIFNAIVVISGFLVLLFSVFPPNRTLGTLVSFNMFTALLGTITIMMILMYTMRIFKKN